MGAATATYQAHPPRFKPTLPPVTPVVIQGTNRPTKKCHHLLLPCRSCQASMAITYPLAVTFWKFTCHACRMDYSIEIVGHRKCLVYSQLGRKTVERIGLTNVRSTYYRAKCYACNTVLIVAKEVLDTTQSCYHCRLDYSMHACQGEIFYQTVVHYQGSPVTFRDKVQSLEGHILHNENMFFLDEEGVVGSQRDLVGDLSQLESEIAVLREQEETRKTSLLQAHAEKTKLSNYLKQQSEHSDKLLLRFQTLEKRLQSLEEEKIQLLENVSNQTQLVDSLEKEKRLLTERFQGYGALLRELDRQTERANQMDNLYTESAEKIRKLTGENHLLASRLTGYHDMLRDLERNREKVTQLETLNRDLSGQIRVLQEENRVEKRQAVDRDTLNRHSSQKMEALLSENHQLNNRLTEQQNRLFFMEKQLKEVHKSTPANVQWESRLLQLKQENKRLTLKIQQQADLEKRIAEMQAEMILLQQAAKQRRPIPETEESNEPWYCDEGEETGLNPREKGCQERQILGLKGQPTPERIKSALRRRIKKYHPDRVASMGLELQAVAHRKTQEITQAYTQLMRIYANS